MTESLAITRDDLRKYYDTYPLDPPPEDVARLEGELGAWAQRLREEFGAAPGDIAEAPPQKIDHNMWRNRHSCEELAHLLGQPRGALAGMAAKLPELARGFESVMGEIEAFQSGNQERITALVRAWVPQDLRGYMLQQHQAMGEARRQQEVADLLAAGGSIKDKYDLYWQQQMDRRKTLEALGSASGTFKYVVSLIAGVPQELLDFVKSINDPEGPMEEQRLRYGPALYSLTALANRLHEFVAALGAADADKVAGESDALLALLEEAAGLYTAEASRFTAFIDEVFRNSPFLQVTGDSQGEGEEGEEVNIAAGAAHEQVVEVAEAGLAVAWSWSVDEGYDVDFSVELEAEGGEAHTLHEVARLESHIGQAVAPSAGKCTIKWDNSFSWMFSKNLAFRAGLMPSADAPAGEEPQDS